MKKLNREGEKYTTNQGYEVEIIKYINKNNCTIRFEDGNVIEEVLFDALKAGKITNPYHKSVYGVGYLGAKKQKNGDIKYKKAHTVWLSMLGRCYSKRYQKEDSPYIGVTVCDEWHNFQNFAKWFYKNYDFSLHNLELDKDILFKNSKIYSPKTCSFVPKQVNYLFVKNKKGRGKYPIGVHKCGNKYGSKISKEKKTLHIGLYNTPEEAFYAYKVAKEDYIKEIADKYKGQISDQVYQAMINYKVEITD